MTTRYKSFTTLKAARSAISNSPARSIPYAIPLEGVTLANGNRAIHYVPTFKPATDEQRATVARAKFRCADDR